MKVMRHEDFARLIGITRQHWTGVLLGNDNLSFRKAEIAAKILGTETYVWQDDSRLAERKLAWEKFKSA